MRRVVYLYIALIMVINSSFAQSNFSIAFIHIGSNLPKYLKYALAQARLFNHECDIYLVANQQAIAVASNKDRDVLLSCDIKIVTCESLPISKIHAAFVKTFLHAQSPFWLRTNERFFYLDELIHHYDLKNVIHLESDNMLYVDVHTLLPAFKSYPHIGATFDCDERIIPGFVYIADYKSIHSLVKYMARNAKKGLSDMYVMVAYKNHRQGDHLTSLPIIMREYKGIYPLTNSYNHCVADPELFSNNIEAFNSVFDGACLGQYLGGQDPRNGPCQYGFINELTVFNPSKLTFEWIPDELGRKVPYMVLRDAKYRINNLHVHSKNLKAFRS